MNPSTSRVLELNYNTIDEWAIEGAIQDHPTLALEKAHHLCENIFGYNMRWRFTIIVYHPPREDDLASNGVIRFRAEGETVT